MHWEHVGQKENEKVSNLIYVQTLSSCIILFFKKSNPYFKSYFGHSSHFGSGLRIIEYIIMYKQKYWSNEFYESKKISQLLYPLRHHTYTNYMVQPNEPGLNQTRLVSTTNNTKFYYDIQKYWYSNDFPIPPPKYLKQENGFHLSRQLLENYKEKI